MIKLLILGTSLGSVEIVQTAKKMGCHTIVTDNLPPDRSYAKEVADEYWMISTNDIDLLEEKCRAEKIDAVFSGVSEFNLDRVIELTDRLGLPCYIDKTAWEYARNKHKFKNKCKEFGIPVVEEYYVSNPPLKQELSKIRYPVVVKPVDGADNKGVSVCCNEDELIKGCKTARENSDNGDIVVERYIKGEETWNFYFLAEGKIQYVYSDRVIRHPGHPSFIYSFATTAMEDYSEYREQLDQKCTALLKDIGCSNGIAWIQFIRDESGHYYALEMAHRLSAFTSGKVLKKVIGVDAIEWMLNLALGKSHTPDMLPKAAEPPYDAVHCVYFQFAERAGTIVSMQGDNELDAETYEVSKVAHEGTYVNKYRLLSRINFLARNAVEVCDRIREINNKTRALDDNNDNMYFRFTDYDKIIESHKDLF